METFFLIRLLNQSYDPNPIQSCSSQIQIESGREREEVLRRPAPVDRSSGLAAPAVSCYRDALAGSCCGVVARCSGGHLLRRRCFGGQLLRRAAAAASLLRWAAIAASFGGHLLLPAPAASFVSCGGGQVRVRAPATR